MPPLQRRQRRDGCLRVALIYGVDDRPLINCNIQCAAYPHIVKGFMNRVVRQKTHIKPVLAEYSKVRRFPQRRDIGGTHSSTDVAFIPDQFCTRTAASGVIENVSLDNRTSSGFQYAGWPSK